MADNQRKSLLDIILRALGMNPTRVRWHWRRRWKNFKGWFRKADNRTRTLRYEHKNCPTCGAVVDKDERTCNRCGENLSGATVSWLTKTFRLILPEGAYVYTSIFGMIILVLFAAMVAQGGIGMLLPSTTEAAQTLQLISLQLGAGHAFYLDPERACLAVQQAGKPGLCPDLPHVHRLVTSMFVHFGAVHFAMNGYVLMQLGPILEEIYGRSKFIFVYLVSGIAGSLASAIHHWSYPPVSAGASGALFGLIGASLIYGWRERHTPGGRSLFSEILKWGVFAVVFTLVLPLLGWGSIDHAAHFGGAVGGAFVATLIEDQRAVRQLSPKLWIFVELLCLAAVITSFVALFALSDPVYAIYLKDYRS